MRIKPWQGLPLLACAVLFLASAQADIPKETFDALKLDKSATPRQLYDALDARYRDPAQGAGRGAYAEYWEPIAMSRYTDPLSFYKPPSSVKEVASRQDCVECHADETPGWVHSWKKSAHANLDRIRSLTSQDATFYKKEKLNEIENNLRSLGRLGASEPLKEVGCIDCHFDVNTSKSADHRTDLRLPTANVCGTCHVQEFAERESERDTLIWPNGEYPKGRPSHALDYRANVETTIWASMPQREIAEGCTLCHDNQNKCDGCHTRHQFSAMEARKPEACATCHSGIDHTNWEAYSLSKHGKVVEVLGNQWNWEVPLKDAFSKGGQTAPTCQTCHMEYEGKFSHNMVRKVRWANYPAAPGIAENIKSDWSAKRLESWVGTCNQCHSESWARSYLDLMDKGTLQGLAKYKEAYAVARKLYDDKLLPGQATNRPSAPAPDKEGFAQFFQLFWAEGNNPASIEYETVAISENILPKLHVNLAHVNPGGWSYTEGWEPMMGAYARIMDEDTKLRDMAALKARLARLEASRASLLDIDTNTGRASLGGLGGVLLLGGGVALAGWRRRDKPGH